jgi:hypothetical protein
MKRRRHAMIDIAITSLLVILLLAAAGIAYARLAGYALPWWTVDSGGGTSSDSSYKLHGTFGQPDAGTLSDSTYRLRGGFWGVEFPLPRIYLPLNLRDPYAPACASTNNYCEDNDTWDIAYGPLRPGGSYNAYSDDAEDIYFINLNTSTTVTVQVSGYQASGQLFIYDEQLNELGWDNNPDNDQVLTLGPLNLSPGKYYIRIYTAEPFNPSDLYQLVVTY